MRTTNLNKEAKKQSAIIKRGDISSQNEVKILNLVVHLEKLTAELSDERELSIPINWLEKWGVAKINTDKLRNYEIKRGKNIYFPEIDEVLGIEAFTYGFDAPCE